MSELTDLLRRIDLEIESIRRGFSGHAQVSRHDFIQAKLANMSYTYDQLEPLIGRDQAVQVVSTTMERMYDAMKELETRPLPAVSFSLKQVIEAFQLNTATVAQIADIPTMTLWRAMRGLPVTPAYAQALVNTILRMTGINLSGKIQTVEH